jgi:hypothetical protein
VAPPLSAQTSSGWSRDGGGELGERPVDYLDVVGGGAGTGVARP